MRKATCLRVLGLRPAAGEDDLREAYRAGVKKYHPDTPTGDPCRYMVLQRAYTLLLRGGPYDDEFEDELARAGFDDGEGAFEGPPVTVSAFDFPEISPGEGPLTPGIPRKRVSEKNPEEPSLKVPPGVRLDAGVVAGLVRGFLQEARVVLPPVDLVEVARKQGLSVEMGALPRDYGRCNRLKDAAVHAGRVEWRGDRGHIVVEGLFNADKKWQRYVLAKMMGYALLSPGRDRAEVLGEFSPPRDDGEEENAHRLAEELLLPEDLVSEHGGVVLGRLLRSHKLDYDAFLLRMEELFLVPSPLARRRLAKYEARLRILLHMASRRPSRRGLFDLCEDALY